MPVVEIHVYDSDSGRPVGFGVMACIGTVCAPTDMNGVARLVVPPGRYDITVGGGAYDIVKKTVTITTDTKITVKIRRVLL